MRIGRFRGALPLVLMTALIVTVGAFATVRQDAFLTSFNLNNLLLLTLPLALVSLGQTCALLVGGFDVSVGGAHDVLRRRRVLHAVVRRRRDGSCFPEHWWSSR